MPQHELFLADFYLAKTPVTNAQYRIFVQSVGHRAPDHWPDGEPQNDKADHPVVHVSWHDAQAYCRWLSETTGRLFRLPSEAEWEKAASWDGGPSVTDETLQGRKRRYPWGNDFDAVKCNTKESAIGDTTPVGAYPQGDSPYGVLEMAGNVYEWTLSLWGTDMKEPAYGYPYDPDDGREETEAGHGVLRVLRGGAYFYDAFYARAAHRVKSYPDYRVRTRGFRVCVSG
jgi:formylglycine-generating enzyme required for sulfatase activity